MPEETFTRSMLGPQYLAHKDSSPMFGFGTGTRDQQEKTYISKEHSALSIATRSPGPAVYDKESTLGRNIDHLPSLPIWGFGSADRFGKVSAELVKFPGPGGTPENEVNLIPSIGQQFSSVKASQPKYGMGSSTRDGQKRVYISDKHSATAGTGIVSPGPAQYTLRGSIGKQDSSKTAKSSPSSLMANQALPSPPPRVNTPTADTSQV